MADELTFDLGSLDSMTVEQIEWMEEALGASLTSALPTPQEPDKPMGRLLRAFAYATARANDPDFTIEDAGKLRVTFGGEAVPPTAPRD